MARHIDRREPRAHWVLLVLGLVVLLGELCFAGYVRNVSGENGEVAAGPEPDGPPVPAALQGGGPLVQLGSGDAVTTRRMPPRTVALTFDDGPDPEWTPRVLDVLARYDAKATFFVIGSKVNEHPGLTRRILAEGHELGMHTFTHADLSRVPSWRRHLELTLTQNAVAGATGLRPTLLRPPYSSGPRSVTPAGFAAMRDVAGVGYLFVLADRDTRDWSTVDVPAIVGAATPPGDAGAVVMMHDGGGNRSPTVAALDELLGRLGQRGYTFPTVSDALDLPPAPAATSGERLRGHALRWAQVAGGWLVGLLEVLLVLALGLALLRLIVQLVSAHVHARLVRGRAAPRLRYLGPVSVIVPAYNESANIAATVRSLIANDYPRFEVIVVDDGSSDGTAGIVERLGLPGVLVVRQANAGKPAALNTGMAHARGDIFVLVDGDTVFEPDAIGKLVQPFADVSVGAVSGNTKVANRGGLLGRWQHLEYVIGFNLDRRMFDLGRCMPTVPGAIGAFRREVMADVGGVSPETLAEDTDLTMAVIRGGWRVVYEERAVAWTEAPGSVRQLWRQRYRWCYGTMQAMWKHRRSVVSGGSGGRLGRRGLGYLFFFQVLLPLTAPAVDAYAVYGLMFLPLSQVAVVWLTFVGLQLLTAAYALHLDHERMGPLWTLPLQQVVYRQLMYLVVVQSTVTALLGSRLRWHRVTRTGQAGEVLAAR